MLDTLNALGKGINTLTQSFTDEEDEKDKDKDDEAEGVEEEEEDDNDEQLEAIKKLIQENITLKKQLEAVLASVCLRYFF